ncbi:MAG TPA: response regulator [Desulfuromonadaceae bacterium]
MEKAQKALVVDDVESNALLLEIMLNDLGIADVATANDGARALDMFSEELNGEAPYSLVLLDYIMPGMEGQDVVTHMRAKESELGANGNRALIIMVTSLDSSADIMYTMSNCDCDDYIVKPVTADMLRTVLVNHGIIS